MLKRWAAWPRGIQWLAGIAAVVLALAIVWALFVPVPDWLAHHDVGSVKGRLHETALDNARGRLLTLAAGVFAAGALTFTARNFTLSRRTLDVTEQGQVTDRYTKAIEQLGSDKLDVRIGGIYALERIAHDSARDHPTVMEVLAAFIREHSHEQWSAPEPVTDNLPQRTTRPDVQTAVTVIGRRIFKNDRGRIDLTGAVLARADFIGANLASANLTGAVLIGAVLAAANLAGANLTSAVLTRRGPCRCEPRRRGPLRRGPRQREPPLRGPHRRGPLPREPRQREPRPREHRKVDLARTNLREADLTGADLAGARWPEDAPVPGGLEARHRYWPTDSGGHRRWDGRGKLAIRLSLPPSRTAAA